MSTVLRVANLKVEIDRPGGTATAVDGVDLSVAAGECLGLVGESGCGKTLTLRAIIGLLPRTARMASGTVSMSRNDGRVCPIRPTDVHGRGIAMVFQEPGSALNPTMRVRDLIAEGIPARRARAREQAVELMRIVGIPDPKRRATAWPHELSGGLQQRVMIAMALACEPRVLLCDEPTTALDVTIQDQILALLDRLRVERGLSVIFVTHDLAVIRQIASRVAVMYAGQIVESGSAERLFASPQHPYTAALLQATVTLDGDGQSFVPIPGAPPDPTRYPAGCRFAPRCVHVQEDCLVTCPNLVEVRCAHWTSCLHPESLRRRSEREV